MLEMLVAVNCLCRSLTLGSYKTFSMLQPANRVQGQERLKGSISQRKTEAQGFNGGLSVKKEKRSSEGFVDCSPT